MEGQECRSNEAKAGTWSSLKLPEEGWEGEKREKPDAHWQQEGEKGLPSAKPAETLPRFGPERGCWISPGCCGGADVPPNPGPEGGGTELQIAAGKRREQPVPAKNRTLPSQPCFEPFLWEHPAVLGSCWASPRWMSLSHCCWGKRNRQHLRPTRSSPPPPSRAAASPSPAPTGNGRAD